MDEFNWNSDGILSPEQAFLAFQMMDEPEEEDEEDDLSWREHRPDAMGFTIGGGDFHADLYLLEEEEEEDEDDYAWRKSCWPDPYGIILPQNYETLAAYEEDLNASIESILAGETEI